MTPPPLDVARLAAALAGLRAHVVTMQECGVCTGNMDIIDAELPALLAHARAVEAELRDSRVSIDSLFEQGEQSRDRLRAVEGEREELKRALLHAVACMEEVSDLCECRGREHDAGCHAVLVRALRAVCECCCHRIEPANRCAACSQGEHGSCASPES